MTSGAPSERAARVFAEEPRCFHPAPVLEIRLEAGPFPEEARLLEKRCSSAPPKSSCQGQSRGSRACVLRCPEISAQSGLGQAVGRMRQRTESLGMSMQRTSEVSRAAPNICKAQEPHSHTHTPRPPLTTPSASLPWDSGLDCGGGESSHSQSAKGIPLGVPLAADSQGGWWGRQTVWEPRAAPGVSVDRCVSLVCLGAPALSLSSGVCQCGLYV